MTAISPAWGDHAWRTELSRSLARCDQTDGCDYPTEWTMAPIAGVASSHPSEHTPRQAKAKEDEGDEDNQ